MVSLISPIGHELNNDLLLQMAIVDIYLKPGFLRQSSHSWRDMQIQFLDISLGL